ncbi:MAG: hypothetical protein ACRDGM_09615, partial [bacterium]
MRNPAAPYIIRVVNGGLVDEEFERVSSTVIAINGTQILGPQEFNQNVGAVEAPVTLQEVNEIAVEVRGRPGGALSVEIIGTDEDLPVIEAAISPAPNGAGWNRHDVTVSFTCQDATSGIESCPSAVIVSTEGAGQAVSGTATDKAGNTAMISVTVNLDKSLPVVSTVTSPLPNAPGWNNSDVTVTFYCEDAVSGIVACSAPFVVSTEGSAQVISGTAVDRAGNTAAASVTVRLDRIPPAITINAPANAAVLPSPDVVLSGTVTDNLSGVVELKCNGGQVSFSGSTFSCPLTLVPGPNTLTVEATDAAGNSSLAGVNVTVNDDSSPPPAFLVITPDSMTMLAEETREAVLVDDVGRRVFGATRTVSDASVLTVAGSGPAVLTAIAAGQVILAATYRGLTAQTQVTVLAGTELPSG